jgi:Uma2 family endonuclease
MTRPASHASSAEVEAGSEPAWDIARLFPAQGRWTAADYLALDTNRLVEMVDGHVEVLEMPTPLHQAVLLRLYDLLRAFVLPRGLGAILLAPMPMKLPDGHFREPDLLFMLTGHANRRKTQYWEGADLVMEVLSADRQHDLVTKRTEYAQAGIPEYWIVDPVEGRITVLALEGDSYHEWDGAGAGGAVVSSLLAGFAVEVDEVLGMP